MENTQELHQPKPLTWFSKKCRQLVFKLLDDMPDCAVEIKEANQHHLLGNPDADLKAQMIIHDATVFQDFIKKGSIGAAEAYLSGKWSTPDLTLLIRVFARNQRTLDKIEQQQSVMSKLANKIISLQNTNTKQGSKKNILAHYDLGNELYTRFLDSSMMYSCAYYPSPQTSLKQAQQAKLSLICDKLDLTPDDHLIEIGTGWGGLAIFAAQHYGCQVTTTTISDAQYDYACQQVAALGLTDRITLLKQDYRLLEGQYDKLVSIEMVEAVGHDFMANFFEKCSSLLKANGKMLLQSITIADQRYDSYRKNLDFIQKYIFPGGCLPSVSVISQHLNQSTDMMIDNVQDIGLHYARTLFDWRKNFEDNWAEIKPFGYDDNFKRLWHFYFCYCEGAFIERVISTHHIVARKPQYLDARDKQVLGYQKAN